MGRAAAIRPLDLMRAIRDAWILPRKARVVMHALVLRMKNETGQWPPRDDSPWGLPMRQLARDAGYSLRQTQRAVRELEELRLLEVVPRPGRPNVFRVIEGAWDALADKCSRAWAEGRARLEAAAREATRAPRPAPRWARRAPLPADQVVAMVERAARAVLGRDPEPAEVLYLHRPVLRLARKRNWSRAWQEELDLVVAAGEARCPAMLRTFGEHPGRAFTARRWPGVLATARAHAEGRCGCGDHAQAPPAGDPLDQLSPARREAVLEDARAAAAEVPGVRPGSRDYNQVVAALARREAAQILAELGDAARG